MDLVNDTKLDTERKKSVDSIVTNTVYQYYKRIAGTVNPKTSFFSSDFLVVRSLLKTFTIAKGHVFYI